MRMLGSLAINSISPTASVLISFGCTTGCSSIRRVPRLSPGRANNPRTVSVSRQAHSVPASWEIIVAELCTSWRWAMVTPTIPIT